MTGLTKQDVLNLRGDLSPYLIHLTRGGGCTLKADAHPGLAQDQVLTLNARSSLIDIINQKVILARGAFSYFNRKVPFVRKGRQVTNQGSYVSRAWLRAVCFTDTPVDHVHVQCQKLLAGSCPLNPMGWHFLKKMCAQGATRFSISIPIINP
jgi:hypothetical protein